MEPTQGKNRNNPINPDRRNIRLMTTGMAFWLSILPSIILLEMFNLQAIWSQVSVSLLMIGTVFFCAGLAGRENLAAQREKEISQNTHNEQ